MVTVRQNPAYRPARPRRSGHGARQGCRTTFFVPSSWRAACFQGALTPWFRRDVCTGVTGSCVTVALGAGLGENMTLLPPIPPASLPSGLDSMRKIAGGIAGTSADGMPTGYRALVGAAQVCAGILLTLMGISAGKAKSEYDTRTPSLLKDAPLLLLDRDRDPAGTGGSGPVRAHLPERPGRLTRVVSCGEP